MDFSSDAGGDLKVSKRILFAGVLGLTAIKIVSACFHNYQLYEVDRLVGYISRNAEADKKRRDALRTTTPVATASTVNVTPSLTATPPVHHDAGSGGEYTTATTAAAAAGFASPDSNPPRPAPQAEGVWAATEAANQEAAAGEAEAGEKQFEDGSSTVDVSACSHGISSVAQDRAARESTSYTTAAATHVSSSVAAPPPIIATTRRVTPRTSVSAPNSPQTMQRTGSGISITAVHLVPGEPAPSTSQLISRLSMAGARSISSPSPAAAGAATAAGSTRDGDKSVFSSSCGRDSPSAETGRSFSVIHIDAAGAGAAAASASTTRPEPSVTLSDATGGVAGEVVEVDPSGTTTDVTMTSPPPPVIIYNGESPVNSDAAVAETAAAPAFPTSVVAGECSADEAEAVGSPLPYFSFTTTSVHIAKADVDDTTNITVAGGGGGASATTDVDDDAVDANSNYVSTTGRLPRTSVYVPSLTAAGRDGVMEVVGGRSASVVSTSSSTTALGRPMVHLFIQPRWALAPSLSPTCTKWETFLRLHHISYTVHEVHVLRSDQPQARSTDMPQQIQHVVDEHQRPEQGGIDDAAVTDARAFANVLTEVSAAQKAWSWVQAGLRRVLPAGVLPGDLRTQYSLPFIMVGGTVLKGSFNDVVAELSTRGLVRPLSIPGKTDREAEAAAAVASTSSSYTSEEQCAIGQAVERTAEYTLRLLYEVGLLLEGSAVFSQYAAQLWSGHRYWDIFQIRRWFVYAWLAIPFLSELKADVEGRLRGHELGGLTREQLYVSLQSDLVSLEQLLVASAETVPQTDEEKAETTAAAASAEPTVHFLLGREPGVQDCALYAYLLPILRLTPRDIARIHNSNFTYIYDSRVFRGFVDRMSREAFPDLDVLLSPPRKPSFVMALSNVALDCIEARATPVLVALRMRMDTWSAALYGWTAPCRAAAQRGVAWVVASLPVQYTTAAVHRVLASCAQRLIPERRMPSTTASQSRRQCKQAWWHFLDFSRTSRQTADNDEVSAEEADGAAHGGEHGAAAPQQQQLQPPQRAVHVDSSTQVTDSLEDFTVHSVAAPAAADAAVQRAEEVEEEEVAVVMASSADETAEKMIAEEVAKAPEKQEKPEEEEAEAEDAGATLADVVETTPSTAEETSVEAPVEPEVVAATQPAVAAMVEAEEKVEEAPTLSPYSPPTVVPSLNLKSAVMGLEKANGRASAKEEEEEQEDAEEPQPKGEPAALTVPLLTSPHSPTLSTTATEPLQHQQQQQPPSPSVMAPPATVVARVLHGATVGAPARGETRVDGTDVDAAVDGTDSESSTTITTTPTASTASSPTATRRERNATRSSTVRSAPSPRPAEPAASRSTATTSAAASGDAVGPRFSVGRVPAARTVSRSLGSTVEPGSTTTTTAAAAEKPRRGSGPRLDSDMAAAARPTTTKAGDRVAASQLRVPVKTVVPTATAPAVKDIDDGSDSSSNAGSDHRPSVTPAGSVARSSTTRTPTRQRRASGLSPGLFTTVVNRKVYLSDGREHPSWKVEQRHRATSVAANNRSNPTSPAPVSRRGSVADANGRNGARSPATGPLSRTVTPIRKLRPSPAGRPTV